MKKKLSINPYIFYITLVLAFTAIFIWRFGTNLTLGYTDTAYHLATAQGFARAGGITAWDFWESLPIGRPHNYPPLFHVMLASLLKIGITPVISIKIMMEVAVCGGLLAYAWGLTKLFNIKVAFWSTLLLAFSLNFLRGSTTVMPATIIIFLVPALYYFLITKKWTNYSILLILMFYFHMFMPYLVLLSVVSYVIFFERKLLWKALFASFVSFVFYLPWLIHVLFSGIDYIKYFDSNYSLDRYRSYANGNLILMILLVSGIFFGLKNLREEDKQKFYFLLLFLFSIAILSFFATDRTINGHLLVPAAAIVGLFLSSPKIPEKIFYPILFGILILIFFTPYFRFSKTNSKFWIDQSTLCNFISPSETIGRTSREETLEPIIKILRNSEKGENLLSLVKTFDGKPVDKEYQVHISNYFDAFSGLSTANLYDPEVHHRPKPDLLQAKFLLTNLSPSEIGLAYLNNFGYSDPDLAKKIQQNFYIASHYQIDENNFYYLLKNQRTNIISGEIPSFRFPLWLADLILFGFIGLLIIGAKKSPA